MKNTKLNLFDIKNKIPQKCWLKNLIGVNNLFIEVNTCDKLQVLTMAEVHAPAQYLFCR
jgi:hypothetical protein